MPKKNAKAQKSNELDGAEFFAAINLIEKEKGIPKAYMLEKNHPGPGCPPTSGTTRARGTT